MSTIRGESWKMAYAVEGIYKTAELTAALVNPFGIFQTATLPDPAIDIQPFWGHSTTSVRNWFTAYRGRVTLEGSIPDIMITNGQLLHLPIGTCTTTHPDAYYTHTIAETNVLKGITIQATYADTADATPLMRRWYGGKVGGATWSANEGGFLTMSLDRISFVGLYTNLTGETYYSADVADITPVYVTTEPYLFSYGTLQLVGTPFARVRSFRLSVDNGLEAKYYVYDDANIPVRHPYEHIEGRRRYSMSCVVDIEDASLYKELIRYGTYTDFKGFQAIMTFTRGTGDTITFTTPPSAAAAGGDSMGCLISRAPHNIVGDPLVSVGLEILPRSLKIVSVDAVSVYEGQE